jgi:hypothetical protein
VLHPVAIAQNKRIRVFLEVVTDFAAAVLHAAEIASYVG